MAKKEVKLNKDGTLDKRKNNGGHKTAGRKSKAEELGLKTRLHNTFMKVKGRANFAAGPGTDEADAVLRGLWRIALDDEHPKQLEVLLYLDKRFFGKEPKAIIAEVDHTGQVETSVKIADIIKEAYGDTDKSDISSTTDE